jgi:hypothetical protein
LESPQAVSQVELPTLHDVPTGQSAVVAQPQNLPAMHACPKPLSEQSAHVEAAMPQAL